ncbi:MAG: hypothetical protein ACYDAQ_05975, partial [Mycobacteriales bacterium]
MRKLVSSLAVLGMAMAALAGSAVSASAAGTGSVSGTFTGTANLPLFPCAGGPVQVPPTNPTPPGEPSYTCTGGVVNAGSV